MKYTNDQIAHVVHEANRALQVIQDDPVPSQPWWLEDDEIRQSAIEGVANARDGMTSRDLHEAWMKDKTDHGWQWGPEKDPVKKTHPCMVPYGELPPGQRDKDRVFVAIVEALTFGATR